VVIEGHHGESGKYRSCGACVRHFTTASNWYERDETTNLMAGYVEREVASSVARLDRLTPAGHTAWLPRLARRTYGFILGPGERDTSPNAGVSVPIRAAIEQGFGSRYPVSGSAIPEDRERLQGYLRLATALL
jgi:hypothetical protein